ncbi:prolyl-tRNA synthetase associated domain-containing protein [Candidatus Babeliales bacterium]|nr:prolyl-tRNA synthetase associated domain-containing protein [Candidatus Babeliales bacterium]
MNKKPEKAVFEFFKKHDIPFKNFEHNPVFTANEKIELDEPVPGAHNKTLFLKNKKDQYWLVSILEHQRLDIKKLQELVESGKLSFASPELLLEKLGITPGSVTPFALMNRSSQGVSVILDEEMMKHKILNFHPMHNDMTTGISREDFLRFIKLCGHTPMVIDLPKM